MKTQGVSRRCNSHWNIPNKGYYLVRCDSWNNSTHEIHTAVRIKQTKEGSKKITILWGKHAGKFLNDNDRDYKRVLGFER